MTVVAHIHGAASWGKASKLRNAAIYQGRIVPVHAQIAAQLKALYQGVLDLPVPERLLDLVRKFESRE